MSIFDLIGTDGIVICKENNLTVNAALDICCSKLLVNKKVEQRYVDAIKDLHHKIGPYYVLAPRLAMPHARPEDGVNQGALQITVFTQGVDFESEDNGDVYLSITLAAEDSDRHIQTIMALSNLFQCDDAIEKIITAESVDTIIEILKQY
ncbi:PTS sugar transporter subunit IIA [Psychromonas aquatilis]|uniref:PTS sugar transporter subunit IIA n=1 Tax=Psychromonas aquatilis TaxID=2005072 RepID=A0ABU9GLV0_9GAMM